MFQSGQLVGIYKLINRIGRGGFGEVWLAERRTELLTTKFAVKLPLDEQVDLETIKQEAILWEKASGHPNVLPIIEANIYNGQVVIVSEYAPDGSLADILKKNRIISEEKSAELVLGILAGLEHLHSRNVIHRDLKPANILLQGETPRLADFGISRALKTTQTSQSVNITGTPPYMSPEAFDGKRNEQTDLWSVGVILYRLLSGNLPFPQQNITSLVGAVINKNPEPLPDSVPQWLQRIVFCSLEKNPEHRFKSASEMRLALRTKTINQENIKAIFNDFKDDDFTTVVVAKKQKVKKKSNLVAPLLIIISVLLLILGFKLIYSYFSTPKQIVVKKENQSNAQTSLVSNTPIQTPTKTPSPTPKPEKTKKPQEVYPSNDSNADFSQPQTISKEQIQQGFKTARQLLINDIFQSATALSRSRHSASRIENCFPNVNLVNQTLNQEIYIGIYRCNLRGSILGVNQFEVTTRITGEVTFQGNSFTRNISNREVISDVKINNRNLNSNFSSNRLP